MAFFADLMALVPPEVAASLYIYYILLG